MNKKIKIYILAAGLLTMAPSLFSQEKIWTESNANIVLYTSKDGLPSTNISKIAQTANGMIWISSIEGTTRFNGYEFEEVGAEIGLPKMQNLCYDSINDILYLASPEKFIILKENDYKVYTENEGYRINGLDGQMIGMMAADSKGRIWIGSWTPWVDKKGNGGLTKFEDGKFTVYDSTSFPLDNATGMLETPYGDLIFNSFGRNTQNGEGSYIALFKDGKFTKVDESMGISLQSAIMFKEDNSAVIDREGNTWIAFSGLRKAGDQHTHYGVLMYDGTTFHQFKELKSILGKNRYPAMIYYSTLMDKILLTTFLAGGETFDGKNKTIYEYVDGEWKHSDILEKIYPIRNLRSGKVIHDFQYAGAYFSRPNKYFPELLVFPGLNENQNSKYPNQFFHLTDGGWEKYDAFHSGFPYELKEGLIMPVPRGIGLYYPNYSRLLTNEDELAKDEIFILQLFTDRHGMVWISHSYTDIPTYSSTSDVGINIWDGKKVRLLTEEDGLAGNITFNVFQDSKDRIWIPTSKGLTMVREIANSQGEQILKHNNIANQEGKPYNTTTLLETKSGDIYAWQNYIRPASANLVAADYFLGKLEGNRMTRIESPFSEIDNQSKYQQIDLREDNEGRLWLFGVFSDDLKDITSAPTRIMIFDGTSWKKPPDHWNIPTEQLHYVGNLENGMYFLTVGDFYVFNGEEFISLSDSTNENADFRILKGASVTGTMTDIQVGEYLYIRLRNKGLVIFDGTNLDFYTKKEGLPSANISNPVTDKFRGNVYFSSPSGTLRINGTTFQTFYNDENIVSGGPGNSTMDGFGNILQFYNGLGMYVNKIEEKSYPMVISSVAVEDDVHFMKFPKELSYSQNSLVFNYAALNYRDPQQTTYEHFLEGFDKDWSRPGDITFSEYQNLPSGDYTFRVQGVTANGIKTNQASYSFVIHPPFWKTWWAYVIYGIFFALGVFAVDRIQRRRLLEKERKLIRERELAHAKEIEKAYTELQSTQKQLIHSEKMASLGELTAGIAHEIQNPLNFVNNFSEVSVDLVDELGEEMEAGNKEEMKAIASDLKQNLSKISFHGNRASNIVKSMLEHSRAGTGEKQPVDLNSLTDEYLRLAYHGLRAKDPTFKADFTLEAGEDLPEANVIPQDIGRVLLNLVNNAFHAVAERAKTENGSFNPKVVVTTARNKNGTTISVQDNGMGIPDTIREKIFQPFFTTKPSGAGTGLGLSLSYDIVTKGHGGDIRIESTEGKGTTVTLELPA